MQQEHPHGTTVSDKPNQVMLEHKVRIMRRMLESFQELKMTFSGVRPIALLSVYNQFPPAVVNLVVWNCVGSFGVHDDLMSLFRYLMMRD